MRRMLASHISIGVFAFLLVLGCATQAHAQIGIGEWTRTDTQGVGLSMTVEACCNGGLRLIYHVPSMGGQPAMTLTVNSPMDGTEVPALIGGKPSGETMAIKRVDARHYSAIVKMGAQVSTTSNATMSADGKTLTVESVSQSGAAPGKIVETWVKR